MANNFDQFVSTIKRNGVAKQSHYFCAIVPPTDMLQTATTVVNLLPFYVENVNLPEVSLLTQPIKDYGVTREAVYDKQYGVVTATFFCDQNMTIKKFFDDWVSGVVIDNGGIFKYPNQYRAETLQIFVVDNSKDKTYTVTLKNVYPKIVDDVNLSSGAKDHLSFRVQFVYESWYSEQYQTFNPDGVIPGEQYTNLKTIFDVISLVRTGANKDAIKSSIINIGTRKVLDLLGTSSAVADIGKKVDSLLGGSGVSGALGALKGFGL